MKATYTAKVHYGHYDLINNEKIVFTKDGFNRCIAIYLGEKLVHCSKLHHPEGRIGTYFKRRYFIALPCSDTVYVELQNNEIALEQLDIDKLDKAFNELLEKCTKEEIEEWLRLDKLKHHGE